MKTTTSLLSLLALVAMLAFSCTKTTEPTGAQDGNEEQISLEKEFGGYETNDESVAFGDTELLEDTIEDQDVADNFATDAAVARALSYNGARPDAAKAYFLRITYGLLEYDSSATDIVNWSGSAEVNKGTLVVLKTIRFEGNDAIDLPRDNRKVISFTSQTKTHFDGLLLAVIDNDTTDVAGTFTFTAGDYSKTLDFSELDSLELLEPVGSSGHQVSIISRVKEYVPFAGGFITGRWIRTSLNGGSFMGRWINSIGTNAGHLRGIWGINRAGNGVFKGKYINYNGQFQGLIAGEWGYERGRDGGFLRGRWVNANRETVGIIRGKFRAGRLGSRGGFFHARYHVVDGDESTVD